MPLPTGNLFSNQWAFTETEVLKFNFLNFYSQ